jgi:hypothetical protein
METGRSVPRRNKIKMDPGEAEWGGVAWIDPTRGRDTWRAYVNAMKDCDGKSASRPGFLYPKTRAASSYWLKDLLTGPTDGLPACTQNLHQYVPRFNPRRRRSI